jgi:hypothetical protein
VTGTKLTGAAAPVITRLARLGFAAKGIVTILIGALALRFALGLGGGITGPRGAIGVLHNEPFGRTNLALLATGLAGYALWMFVEAILDPERKGASFQGLAERLAFFVTGLGFALMAYATVNLLLGTEGNGTMGLDDLANILLTPRLGRWSVGLVGVIVMTAGLLQIRLGISAGFGHILQPMLSRLERLAVTTSGVVGYVALGILSLMVGYSLVQVAVRYDPSRAGGWDDALKLLAGLEQGRWLLGIVSAGLILYGFYFVLLMRYRAL